MVPPSNFKLLLFDLAEVDTLVLYTHNPDRLICPLLNFTQNLFGILDVFNFCSLIGCTQNFLISDWLEIVKTVGKWQSIRAKYNPG